MLQLAHQARGTKYVLNNVHFLAPLPPFFSMFPHRVHTESSLAMLHHLNPCGSYLAPHLTSFLPYCPSLPGIPILQARILQWVAISFSRGSSQHRNRTWVSPTAGRPYCLSRQVLLWREKCSAFDGSLEMYAIEYINDQLVYMIIS